MFSRTLAVTVATMFLTACGAQSQAQAQATKFNLRCVGETWFTVGGQNEKKTSKWKADIRVDLEERKWCIWECDRILDIVEVTDDQIVLQELKQSLETHGENWIEVTTFVNRMSGDYLTVQDQNLIHGETSATCERRPFTGITPKF